MSKRPKEAPTSAPIDEVLAFVVLFLRGKQYPPTLGEIGLEFDVSPGTAGRRVKTLCAQGYLERAPNRAGFLRVMPKASRLKATGLKKTAEIVADRTSK